MSMQGADYITTDEAAALLGYTPQHVCRLVRSGALEGKKLGRDWIVLRESVRRRLESRVNYSLPLNGLGVPSKGEERPTPSVAPKALSFEDILSGGEPSVE